MLQNQEMLARVELPPFTLINIKLSNFQREHLRQAEFFVTLASTIWRDMSDWMADFYIDLSFWDEMWLNI